MSTQRNPPRDQDDAQLRIVAHRLQQTGGKSLREAGARSAAAEVPLQEMPSGEVAPVHQRQIVLVDRDVDALRDIAIALRDQFDFHVTISGNEALALLQTGTIDAIVVGQTLYSSTGINVLAEARRRAPAVRRVLLASAVEATDLERVAPSAAPFRLLQRPCTPQKLLDIFTTAESDHRRQEKIVVPAKPEPVAEPPPTITLRMPTPNPGDYEHVVLETPPEPRRRSPRRFASENDSASQHLPIVVYTDNAEFYHAICRALQNDHDVRLATQLENAVEMAEMGVCPVLITDRAATQTELQRISIALRAVEPALVTIASGTPNDGLALRKLLNTPALHAFLPKPLSTPLVRLTVDAAKRHHIELKSPATIEAEPKLGTTIATSTARPTPRPLAYRPASLFERNVTNEDRFDFRRFIPHATTAATVLVVIAAGIWFWQKHSQDQARTQVMIDAELSLAQKAYDAGDYVTPENANALYFYERVLKRDSAQAQALTGVDNVVEKLVEQIERQLTEDKLDAAAQSVTLLRDLRPDHKRLAFLDNQVRKASAYRQAQHLAEQSAQVAREEASKVAAANARLIESRAAESLSPTITNATQRIEAVTRWLSLAKQRVIQGRLVSPEADSAEYYLRLAERADPNNSAVDEGLRDIGNRLLMAARDAITKQQLDTARKHVADAARFGADANAIARTQSDIASAVDANARANFLRLVLQRTRENALFEPAQDSAKYYLSQLQRLDSTGAETRQATRAIALRLVDNANQATDQRQFNTAIRLLDETRRLGYAGDELTAAESKLQIARTPTPASQPLREPPQLAAPKVIRSAAAKFPDDAMAAGVSGWVDVEFKINASGDVYDVVAMQSYPPGPFAAKFERAALAAIRQYKYEARNLAEGQVQKWTVRVQFKLQ